MFLERDLPNRKSRGRPLAPGTLENYRYNLGIVSDDTAESAADYAAEAGLDFPHVLDDGSFDRDYVVQVLPTTYVLDANGGIVAKHSGPISETRLPGSTAMTVASGSMPKSAPSARPLAISTDAELENWKDILRGST